MHRSRAFDALGYTFDVSAEDRRLVGYFEYLLSAFAAPVTSAHHYELRASGTDSQDQAYELCLDAAVIGGAPVPEGLVGTLVHDLNFRALGSCGHLVLHAGGVEHGGMGVALPGVMEAGKTTLVAGLVRSGLGYLSDEAVALDRSTLEVQPYPKPLSLDRGSWTYFPELEPHADLPSDGYKADQWQVPPAAIRPEAAGRPCAVGLVVFPRYEPGADTALEPLRRAEAVVELAKNTFRFNEQGREALDVLAEVARGAECHRLTMGDLDGAVALVRGLLGVPVVGRAS